MDTVKISELLRATIDPAQRLQAEEQLNQVIIMLPPPLENNLPPEQSMHTPRDTPVCPGPGCGEGIWKIRRMSAHTHTLTSIGVTRAVCGDVDQGEGRSAGVCGIG